jgi:cysteinyl-tRNA synthetase
MAPALAAVFEFAREINKVMDNQGLSPNDKQKVQEVLKGINSVLGVMDLELPEPDERIAALIKERDKARRDKDWKRADRIREELKEMGVEVIDTRDGTVWRAV